jgi:hypothetical protein
MSGPMPGSMDESPAVTCLRHYGSLEAAIEALKAVAGRVALDEPVELTEVASLKADVAFSEAEGAAVKAEVAALKAEIARLTDENRVLKEQVASKS